MLTKISIFALAVVLVGALRAQTSTATVDGLVQDASTAAVPDAKATVKNVDTGVLRTASTNHEGRFTIPFLLPGLYEVTVEKQGFKRYSQVNIKLDVQQTLSLQVALEVGTVASSIDVTSTAAPLTTTDATVATSVQTRAVTDLPLNSRLTLSLVALVPGVFTGVSSASGDASAASVYTPMVGGGQQATTEVFVDGAPQSAIDPTGGARVIGGLPPSPDAVQEFSVQSNWMPAEYGRSGGGVINVATKQGTNSLHGSAREFYRNSKMDANDFFSNKYGVPLQSFIRNQYGFSVGGPVLLPKVYDGRNRTFFFVDLDNLGLHYPESSTQTMPLDQWRTGNFAGLQDYAGQAMTIYDPLTTTSNGQGGYTRTPFSGNVIPANRLSPIALNITKYWPEPDQASQNAYTPYNNWYKTGKFVENDSNLTVRLDHNFTNDWRSYWRVNRATDKPTPALLLGTGADDVWATDRARYNAVWDNILMLNPTTIVDLRFGFTRWNQSETNLTNGFNSNTLGFPDYLHAQTGGEAAYFPGIGVSGVAGIGGGGGILWRSNTYDSTGSLTKIMAKHMIKMGMDYRKYFLNFYQSYYGGPNGSFNFDDGWTRQDPYTYSPTNGFGFASFMLGAASGGDLWNTPQQALASGYFAWYIEDTYRITNKLTLNIGLRYDFDDPRTERYNRMSYFNLNLPSPLAGQVPQYPNLVGAMQFMSADHRQQTPTVYDQFGPRFGFAYQVNAKTVVRGGYAMMYDASPQQAANHNAGFEGFRLENDMVTTANGLTPLNYLDNPFPNGFKTVSRSPLVDTGFGVGESWIPAYQSPNIQQYNLTVQRQLPSNLVVEVGYVGTQGHHLTDGDNSNYNQLDPKYMALGNQLYQQVPNPFYGVITNPQSPLSLPTVSYAQTLAPYPQLTGLNLLWRPYGNSNWNALEVRAEKRLSNGLNFLAAFTWSKLITDSEPMGYFSSGGYSTSTQNTYNRASQRAVSVDDVPEKLVLSADYELPIGHGRKLLSGSNRAVDAFIGGWQLNGIWTLQAGQPIPIFQPVNQTGIGSSMQRPNNNGQSATYTSGSENDKITQWFDTSVFSISAPFTFGDAPRTITSVREPGIANVDASLFKNFGILKENRLRAQLRLEAFNALNKTQFGRVNSTIGVAGAGSITSVAVNPRQVQIALKLIF